MFKVSRVSNGLAALAAERENSCPNQDCVSQFIQEKYSNHFAIPCFPKGDPSLEPLARDLNARIRVAKEQ